MTHPIGPPTPDEWATIAAGGRDDVIAALTLHFSAEGDPLRAAERAEALVAYYDQWQRKATIKAITDHLATDDFCATIPDWMCDGGYDDHHRCIDWSRRILNLAKEDQ